MLHICKWYFLRFGKKTILIRKFQVSNGHVNKDFSAHKQIHTQTHRQIGTQVMYTRDFRAKCKISFGQFLKIFITRVVFSHGRRLFLSFSLVFHLRLCMISNAVEPMSCAFFRYFAINNVLSFINSKTFVFTTIENAFKKCEVPL